jgi:hypothetical protein
MLALPAPEMQFASSSTSLIPFEGEGLVENLPMGMGPGQLIQVNQQFLLGNAQPDAYVGNLLSRLGALAPRITPPATGDGENIQQEILHNAQAIEHLEHASTVHLQQTMQVLQQAENVASSHENKLQHTFHALTHLENMRELKQERDESIFAELKWNLGDLRNDITFLQGVVHRWGGWKKNLLKKRTFCGSMNNFRMPQQKFRNFQPLWPPSGFWRTPSWKFCRKWRGWNFYTMTPPSKIWSPPSKFPWTMLA